MSSAVLAGAHRREQSVQQYFTGQSSTTRFEQSATSAGSVRGGAGRRVGEYSEAALPLQLMQMLICLNRQHSSPKGSVNPLGPCQRLHAGCDGIRRQGRRFTSYWHCAMA